MFWFIIFIVIIVAVMINMSNNKTGAFAKDGNCIKCGKNVDKFDRLTLSDESLVCGDCSRRVPKYYKEYAMNYWNAKDFDDYIKYLDYSNEKLLPIFERTESYGDLYIDEKNGLFIVGHGLFSSSKPELDQPIFEFKDLKRVDFNFEPEKLKEGIFRTTVKGNVYLVYEMENINIGESIAIMYDESARAEQNFFKTKITYDLPERLKDFEMKFIAIYLKFQPINYESNNENDEIKEALNIFMFDSIEEVTHDKLKDQRNRLIKAFHPDENGEIDSKYAAKINNAFKILDEKCSS